MSLLALLLGAVLVLVTLIDAFEVVLLPRPVRRQVRLNRYFFKWTWAAWACCSRLWPSGRRREDFIGVYGPLSMVLLFVLWGASLIFGFGLMQWALQRFVPDAGSDALIGQIIVSGDAFFTLGYGDNVPHSAVARLLVIVEAGIGFGFIALTIGYLPVLYQHFTRRDLQLIEFAARAGSPPTTGALLEWHAQGNSEALERWLKSWELWASDLIESQAVYPMLAFYRSQHEGHSWLGSLAVVIDLCTLIVAGADTRNGPRPQAAATFSALRRVLDEASDSLRVAPLHTVSGRQMNAQAWRLLTPKMQKILPDWGDDAAAMETVDKLRQTYEPRLEALAAYLMLHLPDWIDPAATPADSAGRQAVIARLMADRQD